MKGEKTGARGVKRVLKAERFKFGRGIFMFQILEVEQL